MLTARIAAYFSFLPPLSYLLYRPQGPGYCPPSSPSALTLLFLILVLGNRIGRAAEPNAPGEIVLGMSAVFTGVSADLGKNMQRGILTGLERANANGGVNGRKLRLVALDHGYEPARTALNMRQLI